jgi:outer membrane protein TolC
MLTPKAFTAAVIVSLTLSASAQNRTDVSVSSSPQQGSGTLPQTPAAAPSSAPLTLTLQDALQRAKANSPQFQAAVTALGVALGDKVQARANMLPNINYTMGDIYTEPSRVKTASGALVPVPTTTGTPFIFIANNGVHEYIAQGVVSQNLSGGMIADYRRTAALEAVARARQEIAARGLVVTVVHAYYGYLVAQRKYATEQQAFAEAERFFGITQKLEKGGEVAHSDVIKAQIQFQGQQRDLQQAELEMNRSHLELAVLLFPDFNENFTVVDDMGQPAPIPTFEEVQAAGTRNNPDLRAAIFAVRAATQEVSAAWWEMLPSLSFEYFYGIDANQFATYGPFQSDLGGRVRNIGYSAAGTLNLPIWNWGANWSKVKQAKLQHRQAQVELSAAQRQLLADLRSFYDELRVAHEQLETLTQTAELAAESLRLTNMRYQAGESTVLEVVDAQNTLTLARNAYDDGQLRYRTAQANVQTLTGIF